MLTAVSRAPMRRSSDSGMLAFATARFSKLSEANTVSCKAAVGSLGCRSNENASLQTTSGACGHAEVFRVTGSICSSMKTTLPWSGLTRRPSTCWTATVREEGTSASTFRLCRAAPAGGGGSGFPPAQPLAKAASWEPSAAKGVKWSTSISSFATNFLVLSFSSTHSSSPLRSRSPAPFRWADPTASKSVPMMTTVSMSGGLRSRSKNSSQETMPSSDTIRSAVWTHWSRTSSTANTC
mmetsp:Transcript_81444/g.143626  ORF Transcript_81444/g.143626 Transcript_81444/m.143626 type:complete len:238 (+) Transcript_81444:821-1534(+)